LQHPALVHDGDLVGEHHRLFLVVRHVDRRDPEALLERAQIDAHLLAQLGVQVGQRLVHQEHARLEDERAGDGDPLLLAARERGGRPFGEVRHLHHPQRAGDPLAHLRRWAPSDLQRIGDVGEDRHVGPDRVGLEDHADLAALGRHEEAGRGVAHHAIADDDASGVVLLEPGHHPQRRCLAAAGRP
jgi:hypothetical protein